ncbi:MAG: hypothetical protein F6K00_02945 [Leptolyngbya sp. SIOISBB]|nr:hypothetical protein [Leptolyngbya sp. SIOISBB]
MLIRLTAEAPATPPNAMTVKKAPISQRLNLGLWLTAADTDAEPAGTTASLRLEAGGT